MLYFVIIIIAIIVFYVLITYNHFIKTKNTVNEAFSTMDVYLKKRWDLIPNLVEVVKAYAGYEQNVLEKITSLRSNNYDTISLNEKLNINEQITAGIAQILAVSEKYPELKANQNFLELNNELVKIEEDIANSRKYYNGAVKLFNNQVQMFPSNVVAKLFGFHSLNMFEIGQEEKNNIKVEL